MAANQIVNLYGLVAPRFLEQIPIAQRRAVFGLNFPLGQNKINGGFFQKVSGVEMIKDAVKQLLQTGRGERVMLPKYGCNLRKFLFQPLDEATFEAIKREIRYSFYHYIVGANIKRLAVFPFGEAGPAGGNSLKIVLSLELDTGDLDIFDVEVNIV
jgi:hypothetical protein